MFKLGLVLSFALHLADLLKSVAVPSEPERSSHPRLRTWWFLANEPLLFSLTSDQVGIPAELKHINKRRKRNQQGLPQ